MISLAWATRTDVGHKRRANEDALVATPPVFAVADGMGGHAAGDVASTIAVESLERLDHGAPITRREVIETIRAADATICDRATGDTSGMGTTITGLAVTTSDTGADAIVVFNVGDSRSYLLRDGSLNQISHDHSVVQELVDSGAITPQAAQSHPERNVITRSLGGGGHLDIDWWVLTPRPGDRFLLCSDGLFKESDDLGLERILAGAVDLETAATELLDAALKAGGADNISLVIVDVLDIVEATGEATADSDTHPRAHFDDDDTNPNMRTPSIEPPGVGAAHETVECADTPELTR